MAAGAVLVVSGFALLTGLVIFVAQILGLGVWIRGVCPRERDNMTFKSGFVAILGRPNVGKSTFEPRHGAKDCHHE